jgi:hypothetical protein
VIWEGKDEYLERNVTYNRVSEKRVRELKVKAIDAANSVGSLCIIEGYIGVL